jgi:hypothetical protein
MTAPGQRHPFLDDLAEDARFSSSILRRPLSGRDVILKAVRTTGGLYVRQTPRFLDTVGDRTVFGYEFELAGGVEGSGLAVIDRDGSGAVRHVEVLFSPLGALLALAAGSRDLLSAELGADIFL